MRWLSLGAGLVFSAAALRALLAFDPGASVISRPELLALSIAGAALFLFLFTKARRAQQELSDFERWLQNNSTIINACGASYKGVRITGETELTRFLLTASIVVLTFKIPSRYYVAGRGNLTLAQTAYTVATLLLGWWGVPWGPIHTVQALEKNVSGGYKTTVRKYLSQERERQSLC